MIYLFEMFGCDGSVAESYYSCWEQVAFQLQIVYGAEYRPEICKDKPYYLNEDGLETFIRVTPLWLN